jgi:hypothetical protein
MTSSSTLFNREFEVARDADLSFGPLPSGAFGQIHRCVGILRT